MSWNIIVPYITCDQSMIAKIEPNFFSRNRNVLNDMYDLNCKDFSGDEIYVEVNEKGVLDVLQVLGPVNILSGEMCSLLKKADLGVFFSKVRVRINNVDHDPYYLLTKMTKCEILDLKKSIYSYKRSDRVYFLNRDFRTDHRVVFDPRIDDNIFFVDDLLLEQMKNNRLTGFRYFAFGERFYI